MLGLFSIVSWQTVTGLIAVLIGIPSLILAYEKVSVKPKEVGSGKQDSKVKNFHRKETIFVTPDNGYSYEFELMKGNHLKGEISSDGPIDIYFVDDENFDKWDKNRRFDSEDCNEGVLETNIDYEVPREGTWYLIIENNGRKSVRVKVLLY